MDEPPILVIIVGMSIFTAFILFLYFGGTILILASSWVTLKTRIRWAAFSVMPLALLVTAIAIARAFVVFLGTPAPGAGERMGMGAMGTPAGLLAGAAVVVIIATNWLVFRRFRNAFPRPSKSPNT